MKQPADQHNERRIEPFGLGGKDLGSGSAAGGAVATAALPVTDNLPVRVPIGPAELEAIETYLGSLLDELLSG
jgi:hypothetical protein